MLSTFEHPDPRPVHAEINEGASEIHLPRVGTYAGQVNLDGSFIDFRVDRPRIGVFKSGKHGGAIVARNAQRRVFSGPVGIKENLYHGAFPIRRGRIVRAQCAAVPEAQKIVAMTDEDGGVGSKYIGIVEVAFGDGKRTAAERVEVETGMGFLFRGHAG